MAETAESTPTGIPEHDQGDSVQSEQSSRLESENHENQESAEELDPRLEVSFALRDAIVILEQGQKDGTIPEELTEQTASALQYGQFTKVDRDASDSLRNMLEVIPHIHGTKSQEIVEALQEYVSVKAEETGMPYGLGEWKQMLDSLPDEERARLEQKGLYAFSFPKEDAQNIESEREEFPIDSLLQDKITLLEKQIEVARMNNEDFSDKQQLLVQLRTAELAIGELGIVLKAKVLKDNQELLSLDKETAQTINEMQTKGNNELLSLLQEHSVTQEEITQFHKLLEGGNIDQILSGGLLQKVEGLQERFIGADISEEQLREKIKSMLGGGDPAEKAIEHAVSKAEDMKLVGLLGLYLLLLLIGAATKQ